MAEPATRRSAGFAANLRRFGPLALIAVAVVAAFALGLPRQLSLHALREHRDQLEALVRVHPVLSLLGYMATYSFAVALSLPVALYMTLAGGFLFGPIFGGLAAALGCTFGGAVVFLVCRTAAGDVLRRRAGPTIARIEDDVLRDAFWYIMVLRLLPIMPLWLANIALGFIEVPFTTFVAASFVGILPISLIYANLGSGLRKLFAHGGHPHLSQALTPGVILSLVGLVILSVAPIVVRHFRRSRD